MPIAESAAFPGKIARSGDAVSDPLGHWRCAQIRANQSPTQIPVNREIFREIRRLWLGKLLEDVLKARQGATLVVSQPKIRAIGTGKGTGSEQGTIREPNREAVPMTERGETSRPLRQSRICGPQNSGVSCPRVDRSFIGLSKFIKPSCFDVAATVPGSRSLSSLACCSSSWRWLRTRVLWMEMQRLPRPPYRTRRVTSPTLPITPGVTGIAIR